MLVLSDTWYTAPLALRTAMAAIAHLSTDSLSGAAVRYPSAPQFRFYGTPRHCLRLRARQRTVQSILAMGSC